MMVRANAVLGHPQFITALESTKKLEKNRVFCGHGIEHMLDVARIAFALNVETAKTADKEIIYTAALLHDIGRGRQYLDGTPHERESARIAAEILPECGFDESETAQILEAILSHRTRSGEKPGLPGLIYRADKLSRLCFYCEAEAQCDWEVKNLALEW